MSTRERWNQTWETLGVAAPTGKVFEQLIARYAEPHRAYHTLDHIQECLEQLGSAPEPANATEIEVALWFHDAINDPHAADNEEKSAEWARQIMHRYGVDAAIIARAVDLIMITKHGTQPSTPDQELLVDIDLSILGAPGPRFDEYENQIRQEYSWVPEHTFRTTRSRILREFHRRPRLFCTDCFFRRLEARAKCNLTRSLARLAD